MSKIVTFTITESDVERVGIITLILAEAGVDFQVTHNVTNGAAPSVVVPRVKRLRRSRLTPTVVEAIKAGIKAGKSHHALARTTGISVCSVGRVAKGERDYLLK